MIMLIIKNLVIIYCIIGLMIAYIILRDHTLGWLVVINWIGGLYIFNKDLRFLLNIYNKKNMLPKVIKYSLEFKSLTLEKQQREPFLYDRLLILKVLEELDKRYFYPIKIEKPTKHGTRIIFKNIFDKDNDIDLAEKNINDLIKLFNDKYKQDLIFLKLRKDD